VSGRGSSRELGIAVVGTVVGAALVLFAVSRPWARALVQEPGLPAVRADLSGRDVSALAAALGLVGLAAAVALLATRGRARIAVGALVALAGAGVVALAATVTVGAVADSGALRDRAPAVDRRGVLVAVQLKPWRHVAAAGGLTLVASGLLTTARGRTWTAMGRRFDAPAPTTAAGSVTPPGPARDSVLDDTELWDRIERGDDPTA
jgi:uncharacterized membrane protein (TIGR02234 family)